MNHRYGEASKPYELGAKEITVTGWACVNCGKFYANLPNAEHFASYCCATSLPCACGGRREKRRTCCSLCQQKKDTERWYAKPAVQWDGQYPIALAGDDRFFFSADELTDYLAWGEFDDDTLQQSDIAISRRLEYLRIVSCQANGGRHFSMAEYLEDEVDPEYDWSYDSEEIDAAVNAWIAKHAPFSFYSTNVRLDLDSIRKHLNLPLLTEKDYEEMGMDVPAATDTDAGLQRDNY